MTCIRYTENDLQSWPSAAVAPWYVGKVGNDEAVGIGPVALQTNAVTTYAAGVQNSFGIHTNVDLVVLDFVETFVLSCSLVDIVDIAI